MHIDGQPLLSRATVSSGRILNTFALGIILAKFYAIEPETITILGVKLKTASLSAPAMWVIGFMLIGYLINLRSDYTSFRAWNCGVRMQERNRVSVPLNKQITDLTNVLEYLQMSEKRFNIHASSKPEVLKAWKKRSERFMQLQESVENLIKNVEFLLWKAKLMLCWHLAMPLGLALVALYLLGADM